MRRDCWPAVRARAAPRAAADRSVLNSRCSDAEAGAEGAAEEEAAKEEAPALRTHTHRQTERRGHSAAAGRGSDTTATAAGGRRGGGCALSRYSAPVSRPKLPHCIACMPLHPCASILRRVSATCRLRMRPAESCAIAPRRLSLCRRSVCGECSLLSVSALLFCSPVHCLRHSLEVLPEHGCGGDAGGRGAVGVAAQRERRAENSGRERRRPDLSLRRAYAPSHTATAATHQQ